MRLAGIFGLALWAGLVGAGSLSADAAPSDPWRLYGDEIRFDVYRKGENIGTHRVWFSGSPDDLTVESEVALRVDVLIVFTFRYRFRTKARWVDGELARLETHTDDDGQVSTLFAERKGGVMTIQTGSTTHTAPAPLIPTNHWNPAVLDERRVLNTLTGNVVAVSMAKQGREPVETERGTVTATRYAYGGDLDTELWYDDAGRWVKLRFPGRDGTPIEYRCRRCQGD